MDEHKGDLMTSLDKLKDEMKSLEERFLEKDGQDLSAILDPSKIPTDMAALASIEHGNVATPGNEQLGKDEPKDDEKDSEDPINSDDEEKDIKDMTSAEVKESLGLALDIAFECVEKAQMILKALVGTDAKADLGEVVDEKMVQRANDVVEEYIDFVEYLEEVSSDEGSADDEAGDDETGDDDKSGEDAGDDKEPEEKEGESDDTKDDDDEEDDDKKDEE